MKRAAWELREWLRAGGVPGLVGVVCALAGVLVLLAGVHPVTQRIQSELQDLETLSARARSPQRSAGPETTAERLRSFYGFFPRVEALPEALDKVFAAAARHSIVLDKGEYDLARDRQGKLIRYQLTLPVKAAYPQVRGFLEEVLREVPAASLDGVTFRRESISAQQVEAQIRFMLFIGGA